MKTHFARLLLPLLLSATSAGALAEDTADRVAATLQQLSDSGLAAVCAPDRAEFAAKLRRDYPKMSILYGGISPQSAYWPEVEELKYQEIAAFCPDEAADRKAASSAMRASMSPAELDAALAFLTSPAGRKLYASANAAARKSDGGVEGEFDKMREKTALTRKKMEQLIARYRAEPR